MSKEENKKPYSEWSEEEKKAGWKRYGEYKRQHYEALENGKRKRKINKLLSNNDIKRID